MSFKIKKQFKLIASDLIQKTGLIAHSGWGAQTTKCRKIPILMYHRVIPKEIISQTHSSQHIIVSTESFEKQIHYLANNYNVISLSEFVTSLKAKRQAPAYTVVLTFDDGWKDNFVYAYPILKNYNLPATIFLTTGYIDKQKLFWQEQLRYLLLHLRKEEIGHQKNWGNFIAPFYSLKHFNNEIAEQLKKGINNPCFFIEKLKQIEINIDELIQIFMKQVKISAIPTGMDSFMTWDEVRTMQKDRIEFGSHTVNHFLLDQISTQKCLEELMFSKQTIQKELSEEISGLAYPNGNVNADVVKIANECGYLYALSTIEGLNSNSTDIMLLKRNNINEQRFSDMNGYFSRKLFEAYLSGFL